MSCISLDTSELDACKIIEKDYSETNLYSAQLTYDAPIEYWLGRMEQIKTLTVTWRQRDVLGVTDIIESTQDESVIELYQELIFLSK